jgi:hypothetical protein
VARVQRNYEMLQCDFVFGLVSLFYGGSSLVVETDATKEFWAQVCVAFGRTPEPATAPAYRLSKCGNGRRVIARAHLPGDDATTGRLRQPATREDIVRAPTDIPRPHVAPGRPPGKQALALGIKRATEIDEPAGKQLLEQRTFLWQLPREWAALLRMHVYRGSGDVQVSAKHEGAVRGCRELIQGVPEAQFGGEVFAAIRHVDRCHAQHAHPRNDDPVLEIERRMGECGRLRESLVAHMEADPGNGRAGSATPVCQYSSIPRGSAESGRWRP